MNFQGASAVKQAHATALAAVREQKIRGRERMMDPGNEQPERPTLACYIVYFTTCALLLILCTLAAFR
jgi:hypothetical protein